MAAVVIGVSALGGGAAAFTRYVLPNGVVVRWWEPVVTLHVQPPPDTFDFTADGAVGVDDAAAALGALDAAIATWTALDCFLPHLATEADASAALDPRDARSSLVWITDPSAWDERFPQSELARTILQHKDGALVEADIVVNLGGAAWSARDVCVAERYDLQGALTHELGHLFGLDHSDVAGATMAARADEADCEPRTLSDDDVAGVCTTYDRPIVAEPEPEPEATPEASERDGDGDEARAESSDDAVEAARGRDDDCAGAGGGGGLALGVFGGLAATRLRRRGRHRQHRRNVGRSCLGP